MNLDLPELLIILVILLLLFSSTRMKGLSRDLAQSWDEWKKDDGTQWRLPDRCTIIFLSLGLAALLTIFTLSDLELISDGQALTLVLVGLAWFGAGFYCFGSRKARK